MPDETLWDVALIGGGPAGATAAMYTARAELKTLILDKEIKAGALGLTSKIANYPGVPGEIPGDELVGIIRKQAESFGAVSRKAKVVGTDFTGEVKNIFLADGEVVRTKTVIIATGAMGRTAAIEGEQALLGRGVSYCATCDGAFFRNKIVAVSGFNHESIEEAMFLTRFAREVHYICSKPAPQVEKEQFDNLLSQKTVKPLLSARILKILGKDKVDAIEVFTSPQTVTINVDGVFVYGQGNKPIVDFLGSDVKRSEGGCMCVDDEMKTSVPGVFACGDVMCNKVQQAVVAAAQGCIAALSADKYIRKRTKFAKDYK